MRTVSVLLVVLLCLGVIVGASGCQVWHDLTGELSNDPAAKIIANQALIQTGVQFGTSTVLGTIKDDAAAVNAANSVASIADIIANATATNNVTLAGLQTAAVAALNKTLMSDTSKQIILQVLDRCDHGPDCDSERFCDCRRQ